MKILVINSGSSSIKFQLFTMPEATVLCSGMVDRIGLEGATISYQTTINSEKKATAIPTHREGLRLIIHYLLHVEIGVLKETKEIKAVGHRVVHGGSTFTETSIITPEVKQGIKNLFDLAPLHNPANYEGILVAEELFPTAQQIAVFDTAFHQTIPMHAHRYAIPGKYLTEHGIRVYGFHGTSHKYVSEKAKINASRKTEKMITVHLGNGCSITAISEGKSIDTTLGFGPMNGVVMGTRSGDIDQSVLFYMIDELKMTPTEINTLLQKESGLLGLTGHSDLRDVEEKAANGDKNCQLALKMSAYRIKKYIGAYAAVLGGLDALVFTAGIGENSETMRALVCENMNYLGIVLDPNKNKKRSNELREIQTVESGVTIMVIPTNEELEIAKQGYTLLNQDA